MTWAQIRMYRDFLQIPASAISVLICFELALVTTGPEVIVLLPHVISSD